MSIFSFITDINEFFEIPTPPVYFDPSPHLLNSWKILDPPPPFILTPLSPTYPGLWGT